MNRMTARNDDVNKIETHFLQIRISGNQNQQMKLLHFIA